jgi:hypothetical protein
VLACGAAVLQLMHEQDLQASGVCRSQDPVNGLEDGLVVDARLRLQSKLRQVGCIAVIIVVSLHAKRTIDCDTGTCQQSLASQLQQTILGCAAAAASHSTALQMQQALRFVQGGHLITRAKKRKVLKPALLAVPKVYCRKV